MGAEVAVEQDLDRQTSMRVIEAAMALAIDGKMTAADVIEMGCMTPDCLTSSTLRKIARAAGVTASSLIA